ncbi:conserved hypothetical protein [Talaromyces stipitatus ATCC 10500]|uniref:Uncharacterized protein n=1 Tax=Talaromyces stipitatus (strain ATCC 10500 / CBS 375.48 / QM 6759 / NRRL 1006) TaxID=441959 RepID=B8MD57_TALSN|nr:uncharacterized protein TSTA_113970 [Talaromyces stipitatus ATCC 10500]EED17582.1 conserved hypothetical protein [Talaromyces stipitatus ATCC 10500]
MGRVARRAIPNCTFPLPAILLRKIANVPQRYWDFAATESFDQQRLRRIRQFIDLDEIPREWDPVNYGAPPPCMPTAEEIDTVLRPWRSDELRQKAWEILESGNVAPIFLRTHYDPDDEKMEEWQRVYDITPEVAGPVSGAGYKRYPSPEIVETSRTQFKTSLSKSKQEPDRWREDPHRFIELEAADLLRTVAAAYILVADQEAFETGGQLRLTRVEADAQTITDVIMDWDQLNLPPDLWEEGTIGDRYHVTGDLGRELYQLSEADMADP